MTFKAKIDLVESMGAEHYAYFEVEGIEGRLRGARRARGGLRRRRGPGAQRPEQVVARLAAESQIKRGQEADLWLGHHEAPLLRPLHRTQPRLPAGLAELAPTRSGTTPGYRLAAWIGFRWSMVLRNFDPGTDDDHRIAGRTGPEETRMLLLSCKECGSNYFSAASGRKCPNCGADPVPGSPRGRSLLDLKGDAHAYGNGARNSDFHHLWAWRSSSESLRTENA